jgi:hypothetical protein
MTIPATITEAMIVHAADIRFRRNMLGLADIHRKMLLNTAKPHPRWKTTLKQAAALAEDWTLEPRESRERLIAEVRQILEDVFA